MATPLETLRQQWFQDFEVLLVDNCSTDQARQVAQYFIDLDPRFLLVTSPRHISPEENFTLCIELARGGGGTAIFHFDDEYHLEMREQQVAVMDREPSVGVFFSRATDIDAQSKVIRQRYCPSIVHRALCRETEL